MLPTPLKVTICHAPADAAATALKEAITGCFRGTQSGYLAGAGALDVETRVFTQTPPHPASDHLESALHSVLIVLVGRRMTEDADFLAWIDAAAAHIEQDDERHRLLVIDTDASAPFFYPAVPNSAWSQSVPLEHLGETSVRSTVVSLMVLNLALRAISTGSDLIRDKFRFFVSHAKIDGQPLARTLTTLFNDLPGFDLFYDADEINPGDNWKKVLRNGVRDSVVLVLRSEVYETRTWCVQEVTWAEEFASPLVVVDLRTSHIAPASTLSLDHSPTVRVPDGNMYRIMYVGLREGLRARLHVRGVQALIDAGHLPRGATEVLVRRPSMRALKTVCDRLGALTPGDACAIVYPDPPLQDGDYAAARSLAQALRPGLKLTTLQTLVTTL